MVALVAIALTIDATHLSNSSPTRLDGAQTANRIAQGYQEVHHLASPPPVQCPNDEPVAAGHRFACRLLRSGGPLRVAVVETRGGGITYQVSGEPTPRSGVAQP